MPSARASAGSVDLAAARSRSAELARQHVADALAPAPERAPRIPRRGRARARPAAPGACGAAARRRCCAPARGAPRARPRRADRAGRRRSAAPARALGRQREHLVGGVAVAGGERRRRTSPARPPRAAAPRPRSACPSGISCVRHGASRASRSTRRSTVIFAIRRQVVSLPPVIVIIPRRGLIQLGLARDVHRLLRVAGGDQRTHAGERARSDRRGPSAVAEELVDGLEQVVDVLAAAARRARASPS